MGVTVTGDAFARALIFMAKMEGDNDGVLVGWTRVGLWVGLAVVISIDEGIARGLICTSGED